LVLIVGFLFKACGGTNKYVKDINISLSKRLIKFELIAPNRDDIPARCKLNIAKSTEAPECD